MEENKIIKQTANYILSTGLSIDSGKLCYQLINLKYGVVETESYILPQALHYLDDLEAGLAAMTDITKSNTKSSVIKLSS